MISKISFSKIAWEDLRRRLWMLALSCLGSFMALPVTFLLANRSYTDRILRLSIDEDPLPYIANYYSEFFTNTAMITCGIILGFGAMIVSIWGFRYLYSRKMVDLYHSVPVKRDRLFFITYVNGFLIWLLPMLTALTVTLLFMLASMATYGAVSVFGTVLLTGLKMLGVAILCFLAIYHFCLVCVMLSGNAFNALFSTAILGVFAVAVYALFQFLSDTFFATYVQPFFSWDAVYWLSPLISPIAVMVDFGTSGAGYLIANASLSIFEHPYFLRIGTTVVMLINLLVARYLYIKRPSELAEHGVDHKYAQSLIRICASLLSGLAGAMIFLWIVDKDALTWQIFGILLCGILAFGITDIILHMNFKSFFAHKKEMVFTTILCCLVLIVFYFDLTGFDSRLPARSSISSANISISHFYDNSHIFSFREDGVMEIEYDKDVTYSDLDTLHSLLTILTDAEHTADTTSSPRAGSISVEMDTTFGPYRRNFRILESDVEALRPIIESKEYRESFFPGSSGLLPLTDELTIQSNLNYTNYNTQDTTQIQAIMDAYTADFIDNYTVEHINSGLCIGRIELIYDYHNTRSSTNSLRSYSFDLLIYSHYTRTIETIKKFYPDLVLQKADLNVSTMYVTTNSKISLLELFGMESLSTPSDDILSETVIELTAESSTSFSTGETISAKTTVQKDTALGEIIITDPDEIACLLPYVYVGDLDYHSFSDFKEYIYLGSVRLLEGATISCYVHPDDLPLKAPKTVLDALSQIQ